MKNSGWQLWRHRPTLSRSPEPADFTCEKTFFLSPHSWLGTLFLFLGNGLHSLLLPVRGTTEGYSTTLLGLLGTSWASGFVLGCLLAPTIVKRAGHVRAFSGFAALLAIIALLTGLLVDPIWWVGAARVHRLFHRGHIDDHRKLAERARHQ